MRLGINLNPQNTTWPAMREAAVLADDLGFESLWLWDHFYALMGPVEQPNFEAWQILGAWSQVTQRIRMGTLVTGITYRNPAVLASMVATLDHASNGRAILGVGAAWNQLEHRAYGIPLGSPGERSRRLEEAVKIIRDLLDGKRVTYAGHFYTLKDAVLTTTPIQTHLPIMVGGSGEKRTLRTAARYADLWHGFGTAETMAHKLEVLRRHCADAGRDPSAVTAYAGGSLIIRDDRGEGERVAADIARHHGVAGRPNAVIGTPDEVARRLKAYHDAGVGGFLASFAFPYDTVSIRRLAHEVRPRLDELIGVAA